MPYNGGVVEVATTWVHITNSNTMTVDFSKDLMIGMLRKGATGDEILQILEVIVSEKDENETDTISAWISCKTDHL